MYYVCTYTEFFTSTISIICEIVCILSFYNFTILQFYNFTIVQLYSVQFLILQFYNWKW
jgi:hypothetical protein